MKKLFLLVFLLNFIYFAVFSQNQILKNITINWSGAAIENEEDGLLYPHFSDASYLESFGKIPIYKETFVIEKGGQKADVEISNTIFIPVIHESYLTDFEKNLITDSLQWTTKVHYEKNKTNVGVQIIPYRNNPETGLLEQLYYTDIEVSYSGDIQYIIKTTKQAKQYPTQSVLAEGDWIKLKVVSSGIYKITGADLKNAGLNISSINPQNIKLYGNGGEMIPEENSKQQFLSLQENAIFVYGEEDGVLNESDYILFYGESPNVWKYDPQTVSFIHQINYYATENHYFIGVSEGTGKRIQTIDNSSLVTNYTSTVADYYLFHEEELVNLSDGGVAWFGESLNSINNQKSFSITVPNIRTNETVKLRTALASAFSSSTLFRVLVNNNIVQSVTLSSVSTAATTSTHKITRSSFTAPSSSFTLDFLYPNSSGANGWIDFFEIEAKRDLVFTRGQMDFRDKNTLGAGQITQFSIGNASNALIVWDITDQRNINKMALALNGSTASFKIPTEEIKQFVSFDGTSFYTPTIVGKIENQNLAGLRNVQSVIVSYPGFIDLAQTLAEKHRQDYGLNTIVVTPQQIYNEFSSGKQDVGAIRDFMRMLYKTADAGNEPKFLLFYGNASYDYKNIKGLNNNFIPTWSSQKVFKAGFTGKDLEFPTDDFYGFLDDDEGATCWSSPSGCYLFGAMDIGIGRFPVRNRKEAEIALDKRLHYTSNSDLTKGSWQNIICLVTDDQYSYFTDAESLTNTIESLDKNILVEKIYTDAYKEVHAAGGTRYPEAKKALTDRFNNGALIINYIGHGSIQGWAEERILEMSDAQSYTNYDRLAFIISATCTFTRYDDPDQVSSGEYAFLNPNGSAIALLTASRPTGSGGNHILSTFFYQNILGSNQTNMPIGEAYQKAKHSYAIHYGGSSENSQYFILMGDPAMPLAKPEQNVKCTAINDIPVTALSDTIRALSKVTISGEVQDENGNKIESFQGKVYPKVFDKQAHLKTLNNENNSLYGPQNFTLWKNVVFNGSDVVKNGSFEVSFFVPKDIDYTYDFGRISFFAYDTVNFHDANGTFNELMLGGINQNADIDTTAPEMALFINDYFFKSGGITNENPVLLVDLYDLHGINTTGFSVGHELIAVLDNKIGSPVVLNNYYNTKSDYTSGVAKYQFTGLSEGEHQIMVKAWDSYNNLTTKEIKFNVVHSESTVVENLYAYPNPMSSFTNFVFEHNHSGEELDITIQIFDLMGRLVKEIKEKVISTGFRTEPIIWDGIANGNYVENGLYIYRVRVQFQDGTLLQKSNKLLIMR